MSSDRDFDLALGRAALKVGMISGPQLTEALLIQSASGGKHRLDQVLVDRRMLRPEQASQLKDGVELTGAGEARDFEPSPAAQARVGKIVEKLLCDKVLAEEPLITMYAGRLPRDPLGAALTLIEKAAMRAGLWMDFLETVRACKDVEHPNLISVLEVSRTDEHFAIITRYQKGGITLRELIDRVRRLKLSEALRITREIAQGLAALHAKGIVHRDVKPENVILGRGGEVQLWRAGVVFEPKGASEFAQPRTVFGTPHTISPEALTGEPPNPLSDVYALGVIAYELATGVRPFEGDRLADLRRQHLEDPPVAPHTIMRALPQEVGELLVWLLSKKPAERPTAEKLVATLERLEKTIQRSGRTQKFQAFE